MSRGIFKFAGAICCSLMGFASIGSAQDISVKVDGRTYQCSGGGAGGETKVCTCRYTDTGDRWYLLLTIEKSNGSHSLHKLKAKMSSESECEEWLVRHPSCQ